MKTNRRTNLMLTLVVITAGLIAGTVFANEPPGDDGIDALLDKPVSIVGNPELTLPEGLRVLAAAAGVPLVIQNVPSEPLNVAVREPRPFRTVLNLIADLNNLTWWVRDDLLIVSPTVEAMPASPDEPAIQTFKVRRPEQVADSLRLRFPSADVQVDPTSQALVVQGSRAQLNQIERALPEVQAAADAVPEPASRLVDLQGVQNEAQTLLGRIDARITLQPLPSLGLVQITYPQDEADRVMDAIAQLEALRPTFRRYDLSHARPDRIAESLTAVINSLGFDADIQNHPDSNALFVSATPSGHARIERLIADYDRPRNQVRIRVRIYEVLESHAKQLGLNFTGGVGVVEGGLGRELASLAFGRPTELTPFTVTGTLDTLVEQNLARNVDDANLVVANDTTATFTSGGTVQILTRSSDGESGTTTVDYGTLIEVTPLIARDGNVNLEFDISLSDFTGELEGLTGLRLTEKRIANTLNVPDGSVVVAGGLLQSGEATTESGIPVLKDIPVLGGLFRNDSLSRERSDLVITLEVDVASPTIPNTSQQH